MSATANLTPAPRFGWVPKLVLWLLVLAIGILYLGSANRHREEAKLQSVGVGEAPPARVGAEVASRNDPEAATAAIEPVAEPTQAGVMVSGDSHQGPVQAAEAAAFASSVMTAAPASAETGTIAEAAAPDALPDSRAPDTTSVRVAEREQTKLTDAPAVTTPAPGTPAQETLAQRRARILSEYEVMRRTAPAPMSPGSTSHSTPGPRYVPYGYPGARLGYGSWGYGPR